MVPKPPAKDHLQATVVDEIRPTPALGESGMPEPGNIIRDRFCIEAVLGSGGMGKVYRAVDMLKVEAGGDQPHVALKVMHPKKASAEVTFKSLERETRRAQELAHPNIVTVHDLDRADGVVYMTMEMLQGEDSGQHLEKHPQGLDPEKARRIINEITAGLAYAHGRGITHADLKPQNIFLCDDGRVKLLDFGIARAHRQSRPDEIEDTFSGHTPAYASPGVRAGEKPTPTDDIYALGCIAYSYFTGKHPFDKKPADEAQATGMTVSRPKGMRRAEWRAVSKALDFDRDRRPKDAAEFARLFNPFRLKQAVATAPYVAATIVLALVLVLSAGLWGAMQAGPGADFSDIPDKSIAVLPFKNLSADQRSAYFVAGMQDLIITKLANIGDLKVISRTAATRYKSHPGDLQRVALELGVANILEGSVQKIGDEVLINVQLIHARDQTHLWAQSYQRTLDNIFGVESEVAETIARALHAELSPAEAARLAAVPTTDKLAYDVFLRAEYEVSRGGLNFDTAAWKAAIPLYQQAIARDPGFALAYARLSYVESLLAWFGGGVENVEQLFAQARHDAERALQLAPNLAAAHIAIGYNEYYGQGDYAAALNAFNEALTLQPSNAKALAARGYVRRRQGRFDASIASLKEALKYNPRNSVLAFEIAATSMMVSRFREAENWFERALALDPDNLNAKEWYSRTILFRSGNIARALDLAQGEADLIKMQRVELLTYQRKYQGAIALLKSVPDRPDIFSVGNGEGGPRELQLAGLYDLAGDMEKARWLYKQALAEIRARLEQTHGIARAFAWQSVARAKLGLGNIAAGMEAIAEARRILGKTVDYVSGPGATVRNAKLYALAGRPDLAVPLLTKALGSLGIGNYYSPVMLWLDPDLDAIRDDPRFKALLETYAKHQPGETYVM